jgi:hypothetical protein
MRDDRSYSLAPLVFPVIGVAPGVYTFKPLYFLSWVTARCYARWSSYYNFFLHRNDATLWDWIGEIRSRKQYVCATICFRLTDTHCHLGILCPVCRPHQEG